MVEVISTALLKVVFDKLSSKVVEEVGLLMGLNDQLRKLKETLSTIQDVLEDAEARQVKEKAVQGWLRKLKDVAYDADDVLEEIAAKAEKRRPDIASKATGKVMSLLSISKSPVFCHDIAHRIKEIEETLDEIAQERSKFHLREGLIVDASETESSLIRETGSLVEESEVYGRQEEKEKIVGFLLSMSDEPDPAVIAVVGLGGLGKTTVAQLVYNDGRICEHFEQRVWVCVSMEFDIKRLYRSIIESITGREYNLKDMDLLQQTLRKHVANKKFLLVLDDVWNENHEKWNKLRIALTSGSKGSKVVVTTRSERVAAIMGCSAPCFLPGLSEDDCRALFEKRAFGVGGAERTPSLEAIGREIVRKCGGVPLAAKALGSLMHFKRRESLWLAIKHSEIWRLSDDDNEILPALKLSYNHLPSRLKQCFAYCSIFPKAFKISKKTLVQLWMAEGFIRSSDENGKVEDTGFQFVDELLSRSLFQKTTLDDRWGEIKMHDLVHDLARSIAGGECSIVDAGGRGLTANSRYSSFICDGEILSNVELFGGAKKLRTFHLISSDCIGEDHDDKGQELLRVLFGSSRLLRALHLSRLPIKSLPSYIKRLMHLRYLNLSNTRVKKLPTALCTLQNLEILDLNGCQYLESLPEAIGDLINLVSLDLCHCSSFLSLPKSIGCLLKLRRLELAHCQVQKLPESLSFLSNLQILNLNSCCFLQELPKNIKDVGNLIHLDLHGCDSLTCLPIGIAQLSRLRILTKLVLCEDRGCRITELGGLNLEGLLEIVGLENVVDAAEARKANLIEKHGIRDLRLSWSTSIYAKLIQAFRDEKDMKAKVESFMQSLSAHWDTYSHVSGDVLEALQPHATLEKMTIEFFDGRALPRWMMELSFLHLSEVKLLHCARCTQLPALGQLSCLRVLTLSSLPAIRCLGLAFYGSNNAFRLLEELTLSEMLELEEWQAPVHRDIFPSLVKLSLTECPKLKSLPSTFPSVMNLEMDVDDKLLLSSLQNGAFPGLKHLNLGNFDDDDLPDVLSDRMSSLVSWTVRRKPKPSPSGSTSFSSSGFGFATLYGGETIIELPMW